MASVKTTLEIPDDLFRRVKAKAALQGLSLKDFVQAALAEKMDGEARVEEKPWMRGYGALAHLRAETQRIDKLISDEFETLEPEDLA